MTEATQQGAEQSIHERIMGVLGDDTQQETVTEETPESKAKMRKPKKTHRKRKKSRKSALM